MREKASSQLANLVAKRSKRESSLSTAMPRSLLTQWLTANVYPIARSSKPSSVAPDQTHDLNKVLLSPVSSDTLAADEIMTGLSETDFRCIVDYYDSSLPNWQPNVDPYVPDGCTLGDVKKLIEVKEAAENARLAKKRERKKNSKRGEETEEKEEVAPAST